MDWFYSLIGLQDVQGLDYTSRFYSCA